MKKTRELCLAAVFTALLSGGKIALSAIPNVEIVTALLIVFTVAAGLRRALIPCFLFILVDSLIYGVGTWVPMYLTYWPMLCIFISLTRPLRLKARVCVCVGIGIAMTAFFGVWTSFVQCILVGGIGSGIFWKFFASLYVSGIAFYAVHVISNCVVLSVLVPLLTPLTIRLLKSMGLYEKPFGPPVCIDKKEQDD